MLKMSLVPKLALLTTHLANDSGDELVQGKTTFNQKASGPTRWHTRVSKKNPSFSPNSHSCHTEEREDMRPLWYQPITQQDCYSSCLLVLIAQSSLTLWDHMDYSPSSYSVQGILQARILEWVTISFSRRPSWPGVKSVLLTWQAESLLPEPPGKPHLSCLPHPYYKNSLVNSKTVNLPS